MPADREPPPPSQRGLSPGSGALGPAGLMARRQDAPMIRRLRAVLDDSRRHYELGEFDEATRKLRDALASPNADAVRDRPSGSRLLASMHVVLGLACLADGRPDEARKACEQATRLHRPSPREAWLPHELGDYGIALEVCGREDEAVESLRAAIRAGSTMPEVFRHLGAALLASLPADGDLDEPLKVLSAAVEQASDDPIALRLLGDALARSGQPGAAAERYRAAGMMLAARERTAEAHKSYQDALAADPQNQLAVAEHAELLRVQGHWQDAVKTAEAAIAVGGDDARPYLTKAAAEIAAGHPETALVTLAAADRFDDVAQDVDGLRAFALLSLDRPGEAAQALTAALDKSPDWLWARITLGEALRQSGDLDAAVPILEEAVEIDPESGYALATLGKAQLARGDTKAAVGSLKRAVTLAHSLASAHAALAEALYNERDLEGAAAAADRALELDPHRVPAVELRARILLDRDEFDAAVTALEPVVAERPDWLTGKALLGEALRLRRHPGDAERARTILEESVRAAPNESGVRGNLGAVLADLYDPGAEAMLRSALDLDDDYAFAHAHLGALLGSRGDDVEAIEHLRRAVELDPDPAWTYTALASSMHSLRRYDEALSAVEAGIARGDASAHALTLKGSILRVRGDYDAAIEVLRRGNALDPSSRWNQSELGEALRIAGDYEAARPLLEPILKENPSDNWTRASLGAVLSGSGDYEGGERLLQEALRVDPGYEFATIKLAELLGDVAAFEAAVRMLERAEAADPDDDWVQGLLGWSLLHLGQSPEAVERYERALKLRPDDLLYRGGLGDALLECGERDYARGVLRELLDDVYADGSNIALAAQLNVAWAFAALGHDDEAARILRLVVLADPGDAPSRFDLALALLCSDRPEDALLEYKEAMRAAAQKHPWRRYGILAIAQRELRVGVRGRPGIDPADVEAAARLLDDECAGAAAQRHPAAPAAELPLHDRASRVALPKR